MFCKSALFLNFFYQKKFFSGHCDDQAMFFTKTIIVKEDNLSSLESRLKELMKYEDEKLVIFGIFSPSIKPKKIIDSFIQIAKHFFKTSKPIGRIWCAEINGTGKGCGVVAAGDKIKIWKDTIP